MDIPLDLSWKKVLQGEFDKPYMKNLFAILKKEEGLMCPKKGELFNAFNLTPLDKVKVVILGQDPYHGEGQAHGLAFSVKKGVKTPPSLKNIYKEIEQDLKIVMQGDGCLERWAKQGVLLLNNTLSVREKEPLSHLNMGWEKFTDQVVEILFSQKKPIVFLLWGKLAQNKCKTVLHKKNTPHLILIAPHPSPFSAKKFFGCKHFSKTNDFLRKIGEKEIQWGVI